MRLKYCLRFCRPCFDIGRGLYLIFDGLFELGCDEYKIGAMPRFAFDGEDTDDSLSSSSSSIEKEEFTYPPESWSYPCACLHGNKVNVCHHLHSSKHSVSVKFTLIQNNS